uniref:Cadherin domain-containing protein n=1 Tax=Anas platyrhynchos platyrhynchos TaxID=8840 RepID=U3IDL7_ANAPP
MGAARKGCWGRRQRALLCCVLVAAWEAAWGQLRYSVPEELPKGSFVGDVAKDLALQPAKLRDRGAPDGEKRPELVLAKALDREEAAFHELVLRAIDGGEPARTGTARIRVSVLDANDNAPMFSQAVYAVHVPEDVPVGSTLVTLTATDVDEGINGDVKYSLKTATDVASETFHLDHETGSIMLVRSLDFEEDDSYHLEAQAQDGGGLFDTATVSISVTDVNDNAPELTVSSACRS